jgi:hypothetical protein
MIDKIDSNPIPELPGKPTAKKLELNETTNNTPDATLEVNYEALIQKAMESPESDAAQVEKVKELIASGELESIDKVWEAAKDIIDLGV